MSLLLLAAVAVAAGAGTPSSDHETVADLDGLSGSGERNDAATMDRIFIRNSSCRRTVARISASISSAKRAADSIPMCSG
jgi:hypothetical protein